VLKAGIDVDAEPVLVAIAARMKRSKSSPWAGELTRAIEDAFKRLLAPGVETDLRVDLKLSADRAAVDVFAQNLRELLLAAPLGGRTVLGIDPGQRTGASVPWSTTPASSSSTPRYPWSG
jgi:uncharacterized protein